MSFDIRNFNDPTLDSDYVGYLVDRQDDGTYRHYSRLWDYFRNPLTPASGVAADALNNNSRPYFQAQEIGLPARITGVNRSGIGAEHVTNLTRKEVVIENDIAWRINTMVDFLFGKPVSIRSLARRASTAEVIESVIKSLFEANGGQSFFHELALLGAVYGFVDVDESQGDDKQSARWCTLKAKVRMHVRSDEPAEAFGRILDLDQAAREALLSDRFRNQSCRDLPTGKATELGALKIEPNVKEPYLIAAFEVRCNFESEGGQ